MMSESSAPGAPSGSSILIVDSWPVLEWAYRQEPAMSRFRERLEACERGAFRLLISRLNVGEIHYNILIKQRRGEAQNVSFDILSLPLEVLPVDDDLVDEAANLKGMYPVSYADCFVVALAQRFDAPVITGDPDFKKLADRGVVRLDWLGE